MRILVAGGGGRVGQALRQAALGRGHGVEAPGRDRLDLARPASIASCVAAARPDWVVNAAGLTDVDGCERDAARAHLLNAAAAGALAAAATRAGARFLQVSTDYVFNGEKGLYREEDAPQPLSAYGRSKLEGERLALAAAPKAVVARTSVVFGTPGRPDFVCWLRGQVLAGTAFRLVQDQRASPTGTPDLARQLLALMEGDAEGTFHTAGADALERTEMARIVGGLLGREPSFTPVPAAQMGWLARRPRDSSLDVAKISRLCRPQRFREAAAHYLETLA